MKVGHDDWVFDLDPSYGATANQQILRQVFVNEAGETKRVNISIRLTLVRKLKAQLPINRFYNKSNKAGETKRFNISILTPS